MKTSRRTLLKRAGQSALAGLMTGLPADGAMSAISLDSDESRPVGQAGVLARLFRRGAPANDAALPRFEDLLEDSFEDQDLRRKLALGLPGRVR